MPLFEGEREQKIMQIFEENFLLSHYTAEEIKYKFISRFLAPNHFILWAPLQFRISSQ
jgi:hypothetical protein